MLGSRSVTGSSSSVLSYATFAAFPATGSTGVVYLDTGSADVYLWTGAVYELQSGSSAYSPALSAWWPTSVGAPSTFASALDILRRQGGITKIMTATVRETDTSLKTTLTDLTFALLANKKYTIEYTLTLTSSGTGQFGFWPTYPTACVRTSAGAGDIAPNNSFQDVEADSTTYTILVYTMPNSTGFSSFRFNLNVETGVNAGDLTLRFKPNINWCEVRIGSFATCREVLA